MSFYKSISKYYTHIFPYNPLQNDFILKNLDDAKNSYLLDIGCAIGELANKLSASVKKIDALDLDDDMLVLAEQNKTRDNICFRKINMLDLENTYSQNSLDAISCFGNTLVHLNNMQEIENFIASTYFVLKDGGKLFIQIINYDRIISEKIDHLATIDNEEIKFIRNYSIKENNKIGFETILKIKKENISLTNSIDLISIGKEKLSDILKNTGFKNIEYYSNFKSEKFHISSTPLIIVANK